MQDIPCKLLTQRSGELKAPTVIHIQVSHPRIDSFLNKKKNAPFWKTITDTRLRINRIWFNI